MIGILFHGPTIFDNGWAAKLLQVFPEHRALLAGTMARTALLDAGLSSVESPGCKASVGISELAKTCSTVIFCAHSSTEASGTALGSMVSTQIDADLALLQVETNGMRWTSHKGTAPFHVVSMLEELGFQQASPAIAHHHIWQENGTTYRRINAVAPGDNILINGIFIGVAQSDHVVISLHNGEILHVSNTAIKEHGLEKLVRFGPIDLGTAKVVATPTLRATPAPRVVRANTGKGVAFIDHAAKNVFELAAGCAGAVTVGDDTTAICGDILHRFSVPVLGIIDGDGDKLYSAKTFAPGSTELVVHADDAAGLHIKDRIFQGADYLAWDFPEVKEAIIKLLGSQIRSRTDHDDPLS